MPVIPRSVSLPIVCVVWVITSLVAVYTWTMRPWFRDYYEYFFARGADGFKGSAFSPAGIATVFRHCHLIGVPICLAVLGYGVRLLRPAQLGAAHLAWYSALSISLAAIWFCWVLATQRSFYELLFPA